jgi:hypothetical protein
MMGWARHILHIKEMRNVCRILDRKPEARRSNGILRHKLGG